MRSEDQGSFKRPSFLSSSFIFLSDGDDPFIGKIGTFIDGIQNKDVGYPTIEDALYVSKVLAAAEKAAEEKREVLVETQEII